MFSVVFMSVFLGGCKPFENGEQVVFLVSLACSTECMFNKYFFESIIFFLHQLQAPDFLCLILEFGVSDPGLYPSFA